MDDLRDDNLDPIVPTDDAEDADPKGDLLDEEEVMDEEEDDDSFSDDSEGDM